MLLLDSLIPPTQIQLEEGPATVALPTKPNHFQIFQVPLCQRKHFSNLVCLKKLSSQCNLRCQNHAQECISLAETQCS